MGVRRTLGEASGAITIDTSQAERATGIMARIGKDINKSMGTAGRGVDDFVSKFRGIKSEAGGLRGVFNRVQSGIKSAFSTQNLDKFSRGIKGIRSELTAIGAAGGIISAIGLNVAGSIEEAQIQLRGLTGSQEAAVTLMENLRQQAADAGVPFNDILQSAKQLLPTLQGNVTEFEKFLPLVKRVAVLNQREGIAGAAFAINEAISSGGSDLVSLSERFNISRTQLRDALEQTGGDFAAALDLVLSKMGITQQTADEMGQSFNSAFRVARDVAAQALAAGFTPLLQSLTPLLQGAADFFNKLREEAPGVLKFGAGLAAIAAVGAPMLIFLGQAAGAITTLRAAVIAFQATNLAATLAKVGITAASLQAALLPIAVTIGAIVAGAKIGLELGKGIGRATGNEAVANTTLKDVGVTVKRILFIIASGMAEVVRLVKIGAAVIASSFKRAAGIILAGASNFLRGISRILPDDLGGRGLEQSADSLAQFSASLIESAGGLDEFVRGVDESKKEFLLNLAEGLGLIDRGGGTAGGGDTDGIGGDTLEPPDLSAFNEQIQEENERYQERRQEIIESANEQALEANRQYERQRTSIIFQYNLQRAREQEDFNRGRLRAARDLANSIADIREEAAEREAEAAADSQERVAEIREQGESNIAKIEEDARIARERAERDHRSRLFDAARRLDATAVANEQRNFAIQQSDAAEDLARRLEQERTNLEQRIAQEQEAHQERLQAAREADQERIADLVESFEERKRLEDEDRAIALKRQAEDHARQLAELARSNQEQLAEIEKQKAQELSTLKTEHQKQLAEINRAKQEELSAYNEALRQQAESQERAQDEQLASQEQAQAEMMTVQDEGQMEALNSHKEFWEKAKKLADEAAENLGDKGTEKADKTPEFQHGGFVRSTGLARLHGSSTKPEFVTSPDTTKALQNMLGNNFTQAQLLSAVGGGGSSFNPSVTINAPGGDAAMIGRHVRNELESLFRSMTAK